MKKLNSLSVTIIALFIMGCKNIYTNNYNLLFVNENDLKIYLLNSNDKPPMAILPTFTKAWDPVVSPDNEKVLFTALDSSGISQIYLMKSANDKIVCVTKFIKPFNVLDGYFTPNYSWSYDSRKIVYDCPSGLFIYNIDSLTTVSISSTEERTLFTGKPLWSPTEDKIAVTKLFDLYLYDVGTNRWSNITKRNAEISGEISWSPDGQSILYTQNDSTFIRDIVANIDRPVFNERAIADVKWLKDGSKVFYIYFPSENTSNLYYFDIANLKQVQLTFNKSFDGSYAFINDSTIVYETKRGNDWKLYTLNIYTKKGKEVVGKPFNARTPVVLYKDR